MKFTTSLNLVFLISLAAACGQNVFNQLESNKDPAEEATRALDEEKFETAISILNAAIQDEPNNYVYISLLASAYAQKAGVDTMNFALEMASGTGNSDGGITGLFGAVPEATSVNISTLSQAVTLMDSIPLGNQTAGDQFKSSMFYTSLMTMQTKSLDTDGDGVLSDAELLANLNDSNASEIINSILGAENALASYSADDGTGTAASNVSDIKSQIDAQDGSTDAEKLRNYLSSN